MTYVPKEVSTDPGPEAVPVTGSTDVEPRTERQAPLVDGLGARADDRGTAEPLEHPQPLVGERPATGSVENPG